MKVVVVKKCIKFIAIMHSNLKKSRKCIKSNKHGKMSKIVVHFFFLKILVCTYVRRIYSLFSNKFKQEKKVVGVHKTVLNSY